MSFHNFAEFHRSQGLSACGDLIMIAQRVMANCRDLPTVTQLRGGISLTAFAWSIQFHLSMTTHPTADDCGKRLLDADDFKVVSDEFLQSVRLRMPAVSDADDEIAERLDWMWHAGSSSNDHDVRARALEAIEIMGAQISPDGAFDTYWLAERLGELQDVAPKLVHALLCGDLDEVPNLIAAMDADQALNEKAVVTAAWTFVCWSALELQREASLGWRQIHCPLNQIWDEGGEKPWTIGQIFRPQAERLELAKEMRRLFATRKAVTDGRISSRIERRLKGFDIHDVDREQEREVLRQFGLRGIANIPKVIERFSDLAEGFEAIYRAQRKDADGKSRAGQRADMLVAEISAVYRACIVAARLYHLASLASHARTYDDLRNMLDAQIPSFLQPQYDRRENLDKLRLRQLFHVVRVEFLQDGEHIPKSMKKVRPTKVGPLPLELTEAERQRGHELFDDCWSYMTKQPAGWRFLSPFGWRRGPQSRPHLMRPPGTDGA